MNVALVSGANGGLGTAVLSELLYAGWRVVAVVRGGADRLAPGFRDPIADGRLVVRDVDLGTWDGAPLVDGPLHALVHIAGSSCYGSSSDIPVAEVRALLELNVVSAYALVHAHLPQLAEGRGVVVQTSSLAAAVPVPWLGIYRATKAALEAWSASLRQELAPLGIDVYCVQPGSFRTGVASRLRFVPPLRLPALLDSFHRFERLVRGPGLDAGADPARFAALVVHLLSRRPAALTHRIGPGSALVALLVLLPATWCARLIRTATHHLEAAHAR